MANKAGIKNKDYKAHLNEIIECHLVLAGLQELKYNTNGKYDRAIMKNLAQISMHAGQKRFSQGEIYMKSNLLALCQYEFMLRKMLPLAKSNELIRAMNITIEKIVNVRGIWGVPQFKEKDEVLVVEVPVGQDKVRAISFHKLEDWQGEFGRMLPIRPEDMDKVLPTRLGGFLNYNGDESETVKFVMGDKPPH